jgi:glycosyltransferase involved in cell wall biosynthesis
LFGGARIVHYHGSGSAPLALLARLFGKKVVVTVHGLDWQRSKWNAAGEWVLSFGEWAAVKWPHRTIVVGSALKTVLEERYGGEVTFIKNGVEPRTRSAPDKIRQWGIGERDYLLYLARLVPEKQCHTLIEAYLDMPNPDGMKLIIAGPTWYSEDYVARCKAIAAGNPNIVFTGVVDDDALKELYSNCYAYVLPSEVEGMSLSLLDALAFGACIVTSDIPANADAVGDAGILFEVGNAVDLADKLGSVVTNREQAARLRCAAERRAASDFNWDEIAGEWERLYRELVPG